VLVQLQLRLTVPVPHVEDAALSVQGRGMGVGVLLGKTTCPALSKTGLLARSALLSALKETTGMAAINRTANKMSKRTFLDIPWFIIHLLSNHKIIHEPTLSGIILSITVS
jgi:hypothetical protein